MSRPPVSVERLSLTAQGQVRRPKRVFGIEIEQCARCGGRLEVIASIEEPELIERILAQRQERGRDRVPMCCKYAVKCARSRFGGPISRRL